MKRKIVISTILAGAMLLSSAGIVFGYGEPGPASAPVCNNEKPQKAWLYRVKSLGNGKYQLFWDKADRATSWTIGYGVEPGNYIYGIHNFGDSQSRDLVVNTFTNKKMYFAIRANNDCMPGEWSNEWKVGTGTGGVTAAAVKQTGATPTTQTPIVTKAPAKAAEISPVPTTKKETVKETAPAAQPAPVVTPTPKKGGFWEWLKSLFR